MLLHLITQIAPASNFQRRSIILRLEDQVLEQIPT